MKLLKKIEHNIGMQYLIGIGSILFIAFISYLFIDFIGYHVVALILLLVVSILAMFFDILPIVIVAILSALIWNFLFIQPQATFSISTPQDALLFLMYFVIAVMNAVFTSKIRKVENIARKKEEREKTLQLYNTLLNSLSHELRTPIATIIGAVDTLKINSDRLSKKNKEELYSEIDIAGNRLNRQVGNLLSMSRLESDFLDLQYDWYDINEIIYSVIRNNQNESNRHEIIFNSNENLPLLRLDGPLIEQVIHNIIHNALQYTLPGTEVIVEATFNDGLLQVSVSDSGKGFPEDKLHLVFDKFYRLPNTAAGGTGLGLSIAKGFVQAHNGNISVRNLPTGGAMFIVSIPAETTPINYYENE